VFAEAWSRVADADAAVEQPQRIYQLRSVRYTGDADGRMRKATIDDGKLVVDWVRAFQLELSPSNQAVMDQVEQGTAARLRSEHGGFYLWETSEPVSLVGCGSFTPNGARIGPVYTPPEHREQGYATALTASVSAWALGSGRRFCFLYTDLANPTSNRIYQRIGYEPVCDSKEYRFTSRER
jgi:predicted GNAT family acetyltransferase